METKQAQTSKVNTPPQKLNKLPVYLLTATAVILFSVWVGMEIGKKQVNNQESGLVSDIYPTQIPTIAKANAEPTKVSEMDEDWKVYSNNKYGFSVKYPSTWTIDDKDGDNAVGYVGVHIISSDNTNNWMGVSIYDSNPNISTEGKTMNKVSVDGVEGIRYYYYSESPYLVEEIDAIEVYKNGFYYSISYGVDSQIFDKSKREEIKKVLDQILATFKFSR